MWCGGYEKLVTNCYVINQVTRLKPSAAWADVVTKPRCFATRLHSATDLPPGRTSLFEHNNCLRIIVCNQIWNAPSISLEVLAYLEMSPKANSHRKRKEPAKVHTIIYWCLLFRKSESCEKCQGQLGSAYYPAQPIQSNLKPFGLWISCGASTGNMALKESHL